MVQSGFAGVSIQTSLVSPGRTAASSAARSSVSTKSTRKPQRLASVASQLRSAQYITRGATTWSPGSSAWKTAVAAAMPEAKSSASGRVLEHGEDALGLPHRGVVGPAVDEARRIGVVLVADEGRGEMDRRHDRLGDGLDRPHRLDGEAALRPGGWHRGLRIAPRRRGAGVRQHGNPRRSSRRRARGTGAALQSANPAPLRFGRDDLPSNRGLACRARAPPWRAARRARTASSARRRRSIRGRGRARAGRRSRS